MQNSLRFLTINNKYKIIDMKKLQLLVFSLAIASLLFSCNKKETPTQNGGEQEEVGTLTNDPAPATFTKKVLIEEFTGEWCGYCPDGARILQQIVTNLPHQVFPISYHVGDPFETPNCSYFKTKLHAPFYPSACVHRTKYNGELTFGRGDWSDATNLIVAEPAHCGLKLETTLTGNKLDVVVKYAGTEDVNKVYLTVVAIENNVPESSPGSQTNAPTGYIHQDVYRKSISKVKGELTSIKANKVKMVTYNDIDLVGYDLSNVHIVAFISHSLDSDTDKSVLNVQEVKAGESQDFD